MQKINKFSDNSSAPAPEGKRKSNPDNKNHESLFYGSLIEAVVEQASARNRLKTPQALSPELLLKLQGAISISHLALAKSNLTQKNRNVNLTRAIQGGIAERLLGIRIPPKLTSLLFEALSITSGAPHLCCENGEIKLTQWGKKAFANNIAGMRTGEERHHMALLATENPGNELLKELTAMIKNALESRGWKALTSRKLRSGEPKPKKNTWRPMGWRSPK